MIEEEKHLVAYFGRQSDYYLEKYKAYHRGNRFTFNIGAFLVGLFWFLYRKLFMETLIIVLLLFLTGVIEAVVYELFSVSDEVQKVLLFGSTLLYATIYGFIGNALYLKRADKTIRKVLSGTEEEDERIKLLKKKGGVAWIPFAIIVLVIVLFIVFNNT